MYVPPQSLAYLQFYREPEVRIFCLGSLGRENPALREVGASLGPTAAPKRKTPYRNQGRQIRLSSPVQHTTGGVRLRAPFLDGHTRKC